MTKLQKLKCFLGSFIGIFVVITGLYTLYHFYPNITIKNNIVSLSPVYMAVSFTFGLIFCHMFHYHIPQMYDKSLEEFQKNQIPIKKIKLTHKIKPLISLEDINKKTKDNNKNRGSQVANLNKHFSSNIFKSEEEEEEEDRMNQNNYNNDYSLIVAEGYLELKMYAEAWISASKSSKNEELYDDSVKLLLKICQETKKWKLGNQVAQEFIMKKGYSRLLVDFFVSNAQHSCLDYNYSVATDKIYEALKCTDKNEVESKIKEPILKKIYNENIKSSLNDI